MKKKSIHVKLPEDIFYKAKEVFPLYGELTSAISIILTRIIESPQEARDFIYKERKKERKDEI